MEMFHFDFMQRAFWAGGLIALLAPILGVYLLLRRQALMADTLSHVSLAGVAIGTFLHFDPTITALIIAVIGAIGIEYLRSSFRSYSEVSIAIIMAGALAVAVVVMNFTQGLNKGFTSYLFGSIVAVEPSDLVVMSIVTCIGLGYFILLRRPLYVVTFDEETAKTTGISVRLLSLSFSILTGMSVAVAMPIVGVLLVSALMIIPAALAVRLASSFRTVMAVALGTGLFGVFTGLVTSYKLDTPPGGTIVLVLLLVFVTSVALKRVWMLQSKVRGAGKSTKEESTNKEVALFLKGEDFL